MEIPKPKSQSPKIYDNTEDDLILVSPSVLENKLRDFEEYHRVRSTLISYVALAATLILAVIATDFKDFAGLNGLTIRGAFLFGSVAVLIKISYGIYQIIKKDGRSREEIINGLEPGRNKPEEGIKNLKQDKNKNK